MALNDELMSSLKEAMKAKDSVKANTLRSLKSALKYKMVEKKADSLTEQEELAVIKSLVKQRMDSIEQYEKSGAADRAEQEKKEAEILSAFLPEAMSQADLEKLVSDVISETGASSIKDMGRVMKECQARSEGRADGKALSELVKSKLNS